jgi:hypothetical protein
MGINFVSFYDISIKLENGGILFCCSFYYLHINGFKLGLSAQASLLREMMGSCKEFPHVSEI